MNRPNYLYNAGSDFATTVSDSIQSVDVNLEKAEGFVPLIGDNLTIFSRQFLMRRPEPVFIDIFRPVQCQRPEQTMEYFSPDKRPIWIKGRVEAPSVYFTLHHIQQKDDLANLDFIFFSGYPDPEHDDARSFWRMVLNCAANRSITRIQSFVIASSVEKIRLLEAFGFRKEGILREHYFHDGKLNDVVIHAWLASERHV